MILPVPASPGTSKSDTTARWCSSWLRPPAGASATAPAPGGGGAGTCTDRTLPIFDVQLRLNRVNATGRRGGRRSLVAMQPLILVDPLPRTLDLVETNFLPNIDYQACQERGIWVLSPTAAPRSSTFSSSCGRQNRG